jgi:hypothetical protein
VYPASGGTICINPGETLTDRHLLLQHGKAVGVVILPGNVLFWVYFGIHNFNYQPYTKYQKVN